MQLKQMKRVIPSFIFDFSLLVIKGVILIFS